MTRVTIHFDTAFVLTGYMCSTYKQDACSEVVDSFITTSADARKWTQAGPRKGGWVRSYVGSCVRGDAVHVG